MLFIEFEILVGSVCVLCVCVSLCMYICMYVCVYVSFAAVHCRCSCIL